MTVNALMETIPHAPTVFYKYFHDIQALMVALLKKLEADIFEGVSPWLSDNGDPVALLHESLAAEVQICYRHGPFIKAIRDAAGTSAELENEWNWFLDGFDDAASERIASDQALGLIQAFDPRPVAIALNRVSAAMYIKTFGRRPRGRPEPVQDAITRVWISTLYGQKWVSGKASTLMRKQKAGSAENT